jgi:asparagine synthase (glutamine-hydrolysing)
MCGIAGCVVPPGERPDLAALERMADLMDHRGPDDRGIEVHENVGLVSTRLAIVDPGPAGHQPMWDRSRRWLLAFNGEVYNHRELRQEMSPGPWRGHSDTETLVNALGQWDEHAIGRTNGPLALAALDSGGQRLVLARDRFGKKPLYLARHLGAVWFASEIKALLAAGVPARPRRDVLAHTATHLWACGRETPVDGVDRLPAGTLVEVDLATRQAAERRWYDPAREVDIDLERELASLSRTELIDRLELTLREAVRSRLMADVPLGTMCSGGLDSSLVTALAREEHGPVVAFNCSLVEAPEADEGDWARRTAEALGVELDTVVVGAAAWRAALVDAVRAHEYPLSSPSSVPISLIAKLARDRGVEVLLTGEGADELFAGYPLMHGRAELEFLSGHITAWRYGRALATGRLRFRPVLRRLGALDPYPTLDAAAADEDARLATRRVAALAYGHHDGARSRFEARLLAGLTCSQLPFLLNRMDKDAMAASVETRVPFLDPEVVRLALNLPLEARTGPRLKGILRDVGRRHLPRSIAYRPKYPGMLFEARRCIESAAAPEFLASGLLREVLELSRGAWLDLLENSGPRAGLRLWTAEIWVRLFLEGQDVERVEADLWPAAP